MKFSPLRISVSIEISSNFEYCVTLEGYTINLPQLGAPIGSRISCVNGIIILLDTINTFYLCEGNLCSEFPDLVVHNKGLFYGTDHKLYSIMISLVLYRQTQVANIVANIVTTDSRQTGVLDHCEGRSDQVSKCAARHTTLQLHDYTTEQEMMHLDLLLHKPLLLLITTPILIT